MTSVRRFVRRFSGLALLLLSSCGHSDPFDRPTPTVGPYTTGPDITLTFNGDQNYWPAWTEDGKGVLYAFVDPTSPRHRCVGLLPAAGGTRTWQLCDNRASRADSVTSYPAFALDSIGRLLLLDAVSRSGSNVVPISQLWLTDTARPFVRRSLLSLPVNVTLPDGGTFAVTWLADLRWTGPSTFLALAQQFSTIPHCAEFLVGDRPAIECPTIDTLFTPGYVVRGALSEQGAVLAIVPGTAGATDYSLAEGGASIVFVVADAIARVPIGGAASPTLIAPALPGKAVFGVGCRGTTCLVTRDSLRITAPGMLPITDFYLNVDYITPLGPMELHRISITSGADDLLKTDNSLTVLTTVVVSPQTGDVILETGGIWGHVRTFATVGLGSRIVDLPHSALHLLKALVP